MSKLITYLTAKLAKEKGCNEYRPQQYSQGVNPTTLYSYSKKQCDFFGDLFYAYTQSELQDWFIEVFGVAVLVDLDCTLSWIWKIIPLHPEASIQEQFVSSGVHSTKQLALEEGLFKALTELR